MSERKNFFRFVIPSVLAFALSGVYTIVDGFFIGQRLGDTGLAAIVLGYPIAAIIQALGTGMGMSGAIRFTIMQAKESGEQRTCLGGTALLMLLAGGLITVLLLVFLHPLLRLLGAEGGYPAADRRVYPGHCRGDGVPASGYRLCAVYPEHGRCGLCHGCHDRRISDQCFPGLLLCLEMGHGWGCLGYRNRPGGHHAGGAGIFYCKESRFCPAVRLCHSVIFCFGVQGGSGSFWPDHFPYDHHRYDEPFSSAVWKRAGCGGLQLHQLRGQYRLSVAAGRGRWKPAAHQQALWGK